MSNIVLLTAAGIGSRTHQFIPKQFLSVKDKPIILYTMEKFQNHPEIDKIAIVCLKGWEDYVNRGAVCAVEWSENVEGAFWGDEIKVNIEKTGENTRKISIEGGPDLQC